MPEAVAIALLSDAGVQTEGQFDLTLHGHALEDADQDLVVVCVVRVFEKHREVPYPYSFRKPEDPPAVLVEMVPAGMYAWDIGAVKLDAVRTFHRNCLGDDATKTARERGLKGVASVWMFFESCPDAVKVASAVLSNVNVADPSDIQRELDGRQMESADRKYLVAAQNVSVFKEHSQIFFPYKILSDANGPVTLSDLSSTQVYAWDTGAIKLAAPPSNPSTKDEDRIDLTAIHTLPEDQPGFQEAPDKDVPEDAGTSVPVQGFDVSNYVFHDVWCRIDQLVDSPNLLRETDDAHVEALYRLMIDNGFDQNFGVISCTPLRKKEKTIEEITETVDGKVLIIESETAGLVDGMHLEKAVTRVRQEHPASDSRHGCDSTLLRTVMITRYDGALLSSREILFLSSNRNDLSKTVKYDGRFLEELDKIIQYSRTWKEEQGINYVEARIVDIRTYIISSNFLEGEREESAILSKVIRYVRISKLIRQKPDVYELLNRMAKTVYFENYRSNSIGSTHLESPLLFQMDVTEFSLCLQAADRNLKNKKLK